MATQSYQNKYVRMYVRLYRSTYLRTHYTKRSSVSRVPLLSHIQYIPTALHTVHYSTYRHPPCPHHSPSYIPCTRHSSLPSPHLSHCLKRAVPHLVQGVGKGRGQLVGDVHNDQLRRALRLHPRGSLGGGGERDRTVELRTHID